MDFAIGMTGANSLHSQIMEHAIGGTFPDLVLDHSKILVAKGSLSLAASPSAVSSSDVSTLTYSSHTVSPPLTYCYPTVDLPLSYYEPIGVLMGVICLVLK